MENKTERRHFNTNLKPSTFTYKVNYNDKCVLHEFDLKRAILREKESSFFPRICRLNE